MPAARDPLPNPPLFKGIDYATIGCADSAKTFVYQRFLPPPSPFPPRLERERTTKLPQKVGENEGTLFAGRSAITKKQWRGR
jgi:hypothetical protein